MFMYYCHCRCYCYYYYRVQRAPHDTRCAAYSCNVHHTAFNMHYTEYDMRYVTHTVQHIAAMCIIKHSVCSTRGTMCIRVWYQAMCALHTSNSVVHKWTLFEAERQKEDSMQHVCKDMLHTRIPYTKSCIPCQLAYTWEIPLKARDQEIPIARMKRLSIMSACHT